MPPPPLYIRTYRRKHDFNKQPQTSKDAALEKAYRNSCSCLFRHGAEIRASSEIPEQVWLECEITLNWMRKRLIRFVSPVTRKRPTVASEKRECPKKGIVIDLGSYSQLSLTVIQASSIFLDFEITAKTQNQRRALPCVENVSERIARHLRPIYFIIAYYPTKSLW